MFTKSRSFHISEVHLLALVINSVTKPQNITIKDLHFEFLSSTNLKLQKFGSTYCCTLPIVYLMVSTSVSALKWFAILQLKHLLVSKEKSL